MEITLVEILHRLLPEVEWVMNDYDLETLTIITPNVAKPTQEQIDQMRNTILTERQQAADAKANLLSRLGITEDEARLLLGGN